MYKKSSTGWLKHLDFMVLDIICLQQSESIWKHNLPKRSHRIRNDPGDDYVF